MVEIGSEMTQKANKLQESFLKHDQSSYNQTITQHGGGNVGNFIEIQENSSKSNGFENDQDSMALRKLESVGGYSQLQKLDSNTIPLNQLKTPLSAIDNKVLSDVSKKQTPSAVVDGENQSNISKQKTPTENNNSQNDSKMSKKQTPADSQKSKEVSNKSKKQTPTESKNVNHQTNIEEQKMLKDNFDENQRKNVTEVQQPLKSSKQATKMENQQLLEPKFQYAKKKTLKKKRSSLNVDIKIVQGKLQESNQSKVKDLNIDVPKRKKFISQKTSYGKLKIYQVANEQIQAVNVPSSNVSKQQLIATAKTTQDLPDESEVTDNNASPQGSSQDNDESNQDNILYDKLKNLNVNHGRSSDHLLMSTQKDSMPLKNQYGTSFMISPTLQKYRSRDLGIMPTGDILLLQHSSMQYMESNQPSRQLLHQLSGSQRKFKSLDSSKANSSTNIIADPYIQRKQSQSIEAHSSRVKLQEPWRDALLRQEQEKIERLADFIEMEKMRTHLAASKQIAKEKLAIEKIKNVYIMKKEQKEEIRQRNLGLLPPKNMNQEEIIVQNLNNEEDEEDSEPEPQQMQDVNEASIQRLIDEDELPITKQDKVKIRKQQFYDAKIQIKENEMIAKEIKVANIEFEKEKAKKYVEQQNILRQEQSRIKLEDVKKKKNHIIERKREKLEEKYFVNEQIQNELDKMQQENFQEAQKKNLVRARQLMFLRHNQLAEQIEKKLEFQVQQQEIEDKLQAMRVHREHTRSLQRQQSKLKEVKKKSYIVSQNLALDQKLKLKLENREYMQEQAVIEANLRKEDKIIDKLILNETRRQNHESQLQKVVRTKHQDRQRLLLKVYDDIKKYEDDKKQKELVKQQVLLMREEMTKKKQKMIEELRVLRKQYKVQSDLVDVTANISSIKDGSTNQFLNQDSQSYFSQQNRKRSVQMPQISVNNKMLEDAYTTGMFHKKKRSLQINDDKMKSPQISNSSKHIGNLTTTNFSLKTPKIVTGSGFRNDEMGQTMTNLETQNESIEKMTSPEKFIKNPQNKGAIFRKTSPPQNMSWLDKSNVIEEGKQFPAIPSNIYMDGSAMSQYPQSPMQLSKRNSKQSKNKIMSFVDRVPQRYKSKQKTVAQQYLNAVTKYRKGSPGKMNQTLSPSPAILSPVNHRNQDLSTLMPYDHFQIQDDNDEDHEMKQLEEQEPNDQEQENDQEIQEIEDVQDSQKMLETHEQHDQKSQEKLPPANQKKVPSMLQRAQTIYAPIPTKNNSGGFKRQSTFMNKGEEMKIVNKLRHQSFMQDQDITSIIQEAHYSKELTDQSINLESVHTPDDTKEILNQTLPDKNQLASPFKSNKQIAADINTIMTLKKDGSKTSHITIQNKGEQSLNHDSSKRSINVSMYNIYSNKIQDSQKVAPKSSAVKSVTQRSMAQKSATNKSVPQKSATIRSVAHKSGDQRNGVSVGAPDVQNSKSRNEAHSGANQARISTSKSPAYFSSSYELSGKTPDYNQQAADESFEQKLMAQVERRMTIQNQQLLEKSPTNRFKQRFNRKFDKYYQEGLEKRRSSDKIIKDEILNRINHQRRMTEIKSKKKSARQNLRDKSEDDEELSGWQNDNQNVTPDLQQK